MLTTYYFSEETGFKSNLNRTEMHAIIKKGKGTLWVDLDEPTDVEEELLVEIFGFHELAIEDCLNDHCGAKIDDYEDYVFINLEPLVLEGNAEGEQELVSREAAIFFGPNYIVTVHSQQVPSVSATRQLVEKKPAVYLAEGSGSLLHTILDRLVDNYLPIVYRYENKFEELESKIFDDPANYLAELMKIKRDIFKMRRIFGPERDVLHMLGRCRALVKKEDEAYFKDIYDHLAYVHSMTDVLYENLSGLLQVYFSYASTKLNLVMKRMTIMATLTMPALLIFSLYGMNFPWMPFIHSPIGFWVSQAITFFLIMGLLAWMKLKKWI